MNNVRIAIRDSTDSHSVGFFDNVAGIKYKKAEIQRFLAGSASILTLQYNSKDIDTIRTGCKLAFRYKNRDYWLNIMRFEKQGFEVEITAYPLNLELNNEERGAHKPDKAMSFAEYLAYYDPEGSLTLGVNQVSDKKIKLEWTGTDTILARLFSIANSFDAELEFVTELNDDYSLKRHVLNVYKKGNLGSNKTSTPVRVGKELKVINYSDNTEELRTAVRATGKDGLTIDGLNKKIYDDNKQLLYYSSGMTVYAPQARDKYPSVGRASTDNWIVKDLGETEYESKEGLWGYLYGEIQKVSVPKIEYTVTGAIDSDIGDTQTLIDDIHFEPPLYLQARVSELTDDILTGKVTKSTFINFERKYSQIADELQKRVNELVEASIPYTIKVSSDNGTTFKNGVGESVVKAKLYKGNTLTTSDVSWRWLFNDDAKISAQYTVKASDIKETSVLTVIAYVGDNEVATAEVTFTNVGDGVGVESIDRYYTTNNKSENVTVDSEEWSDEQTEMTADKKYAWSYDVITYSDGTTKVTKPVIIGIRGDDGLDADALGITDSLNETKKELSGLAANIDKLKADTLVAGDEAKKQIETVSNDLSKAKMDLQNAVSAVDTKATNLQSDLTTAKQDLTSQASQLQAQASAQSELTKRVSTVEKTANGTKTTVSELSKTVTQNGKDITSVTAQTKTVEDDLANTKTTLTQVQTTANRASQKTAALETGLNGLSARFSSLRVGGHNYLRGTSDQYQTLTSNNYILGYTGNKNISFLDLLEPLKGETVTIRSYIKNDTDSPVRIQIRFTGGGINGNPVPAHEEGYSVATGKILENFASCNIAFTQVGDGTKNGGTIQHKEDKLEKGNIATDYSPNDADLEQKVAEYRQNADQNYASLSSTVQTLDGQVQSNKTTAEQTAQGFKTRIESLETYKNGESERANVYLESAKTETAKQLTVERTAIANNYVAKSTYTSDVTGIRNELSATTSTANATKTNLANYQASNDRVVANLQSNLQTANGNISNLQTKVEAVPGQITSAVSAVEGKIPTTMGGRNYIQNYGLTVSGWSLNMSKWLFEIVADNTARSGQYLKATCTKAGTYGFFNRFVDLRGSEWQGKKMTYSIDIKASKSVQMTVGVEAFNGGVKKFNVTTAWQRFVSTDMVKFKNFYAFPFYIPDGGTWAVGDVVYLRDVQLEDGTIATAPKPAVEDTQSDITKLNTTLTQTANGLKQLSTQVTSQGSTITSHTNSINSLTTGLSAKVSQTDFNTLSGRVTTAENNIIAKANELSSKISSLNIGNKNYLPTSRVINRGCSNFSYSETSKSWTMTVPASSTTFGNGITFNTSGLNILLNGSETLFFGLMIKASKACSFNYDINNALSGTASNDNDDRSKQAWSPSNKSIPANVWTRVWFSYTAKANVPITEANSNFGIVNNTEAITVEIKEVMVAKSNVPVDYQTPDADFEAKDSELKQTTDSIKASVSALDKSTVKSASLTINADGIVMKAGKSTTDVANAIGSYFAVNQNAINLFSDKINVKANMIVNGAITSDKIAAGAINADKISASGITADKIKGGMLQSKTNTTKFDLDSGKLFYNSNNTGIFRIQNNASTMGLKFSNTNITVNGSSHILSRVILGGDRRETTLDDGKWDQGGFSGIVAETINGIAANEHDKADTVRVVADNIYFTHSYSKDVATNTSAAGWKMETFSPNSTYTGHIVMKPFGINYRYADIVTGDVRLDNGDGSGYWVRGCIQVLRNCFQHFLNGGTSNDAKNAIRNALKDISGV